MNLALEPNSSSQFSPAPTRLHVPVPADLITYTVYSDDRQYTVWLEVKTDCTVTITAIADLDVPKTDFQHQKDAFLQLSPLELYPYQGQYVVSRNGEIVANDHDLPSLTARYFQENPNTPVYVTKVGDAIPEVVVSRF